MERRLAEVLKVFVYAPWECKGIINYRDAPGPNTVWVHDPNVPDSFMRRVPIPEDVYERGHQLLSEIRKTGDEATSES